MSALSVRQLRKVYPNGIIALKGIDLEVAEGDFFALLGQNGAGKSTTIGIVSSFINKSSGKVKIFGHDMDGDTTRAKSLIGLMPQEFNFGTFETISNILLYQAGFYGIPRRVALSRIETHLSEMGLWEMRNQPSITLSGGMKRRLMVARALMNEPKLLILDEPTAGVDIELRHLLWRYLAKLNKQGTTIILTTHYLEEAERLCKNVAIIDRGEIIENASVKSLVKRINVQTLILDLDKPLKEPPQIDGYNLVLNDELTLEVQIQGSQSINELFHLLNKHKITISSLRNKSNRLEELFIHLVAKNKKNKDR